MRERPGGLSKIINRITEITGGSELKQFREYDTRIHGIADSSFGEVRPINENGNRVMFIGDSKAGKKIVMSKSHFNDLLTGACWVQDPSGTRQAFWKLSEGIKNHDLGIRDMTREVFYFHGARLFTLVAGKEVEVQQVGYGFDFGGIHYVQSATIKPSGGDWGGFDKKLAADFVTNKSGIWGRIKDW